VSLPSMFVMMLLACTGAQGPDDAHDDKVDVEKPKKGGGKKGGKDKGGNDDKGGNGGKGDVGDPDLKKPGKNPDILPEARGRLEKSSDKPTKDYTNFRPPKKKGNCIGQGRYKFQMPGYDSRSLLIVPDGPTPRTLVVALHGGGGDSKKILEQTRWDSLAIQEGGVAVLAPEGAAIDKAESKWNSGKWDDADHVDTSNARDDVKYLDELVRYVSDAVCVERVVAVGFSNGAQMTYRWACQGSEVDAAITSAGTLLVDPKTCKNQVPFRAYIGTNDDLYDSSPLEGADQPNAVKSLELMAKQNGCDLSKEPDMAARGAQTCKAYKGCKAPTVLCEIDGYPHGHPVPWGKKPTDDCDATQEGWSWMAKQL